MPVTEMRMILTIRAIGTALSRMMNLSHQGRSIKKTIATANAQKMVSHSQPAAGVGNETFHAGDVDHIALAKRGQTQRLQNERAADAGQAFASAPTRWFPAGRQRKHEDQKAQSRAGPTNDVETADQHEDAKVKTKEPSKIDFLKAVL